MTGMPPTGPHARARVLHAGTPLENSRLAVILLHGRGATAEDILSLAEELDIAEAAYLAPQATGFTWYPNSFLAPVSQNEPFLSSAIGVVHHLIDSCARAGIPQDRVVIGGFSQGACLALESAARFGNRFRAVLAFSGGLIGQELQTQSYAKTLARTPVFLGSDERDPYIPAARVMESALQLEALGARVIHKLYKNLGHSISREEIQVAQAMVHEVAADD